MAGQYHKIHTHRFNPPLIICSSSLSHTFPVGSVPLAGTVQRFLEVVLHHGGVARAVQWDRPGLESALTAALAKPSVAVYVEVEYGGGRTFPVTRIHRHLRGVRDKEDRSVQVRRRFKILVCFCVFVFLTGELLLQSSFLMVVRIATRLHVFPSSLPAHFYTEITFIYTQRSIQEDFYKTNKIELRMHQSIGWRPTGLKRFSSWLNRNANISNTFPKKSSQSELFVMFV